MDSDESFMFIILLIGHVIFAQTDNEELSIFVEAEKTVHTVVNLKCGTKYSFQIETLSSVGRSEKSNAVSARTKGDGNFIISFSTFKAATRLTR